MADLLEQTVNHGVVTRKSTTEHDGKLHIETFQDIEPNVEMVRNMRNDDFYTQRGIKHDLAHALHIPEVIQVELIINGVNIYTCSAKEIVAGLHRIGKFDACNVSKKKLWRG